MTKQNNWWPRQIAGWHVYDLFYAHIYETGNYDIYTLIFNIVIDMWYIYGPKSLMYYCVYAIPFSGAVER